MEATLRKTGALLGKDVADLAKNPTMLICTLLPIAFVLFYAQVSGGSSEESEMLSRYLVSMAFCITAGMVGSMTVLTSIAEEKEKNTLRTLMLANVSAGQILASKGIVAFASIALVDAICFALLKIPADQIVPYLVISLLGSVPIIMIALLLGLAARDQMTAGLYSLPIVLIAFLPSFAMVNETLEKFAPFFPTGGASELINLSAQGSLLTGDALQPLLVTLVWVVLSTAAFALLYQHLSRDN